MRTRTSIRLCIAAAIGIAGTSAAFGALTTSQIFSTDIASWLSGEIPKAESYMQANISPDRPGFAKGFVMAAPWIIPGVQNYEYHWVRDAALVMNTVVTRYIESDSADARANYFGQLRDYADFSKQNQTAPEPNDAEKVGLGEVKFNPDGSRYTRWMRPQNDGPALRAITLIRFSTQLLGEGKADLAKHLYDGSITGEEGFHAEGVIKADLDYVASHWKDVSFDPWEEVKGHHFYTELVQRKALLDGASFARHFGDQQSARRYQSEALALEADLETHWIAAGKATPSGSVSDGQIWDTFGRVSGVDYKASGLDVAAILAALHAHNELDQSGDRFFSASDPRVLKTAAELAEAFRKGFPIARGLRDGDGLGVPIGRYPEDKYNGYDSKGEGNPWYLATAAFAELYYRCAEEWVADSEILVGPIDMDFLASLTHVPLQKGEMISSSDPRFEQLVTAVRQLGDTYLRQVALRAGGDGHLTEEFSRTNGSPQGAVDLSWSYASILTAAKHR